MLKIKDRRKLDHLEVRPYHDRCLSQASFNSDGTITIQNSPYFCEGEVQSLVLGRDETRALIRLFRELSLWEMAKAEEKLQ